jgi:hypothetical protein
MARHAYGAVPDERELVLRRAANRCDSESLAGPHMRVLRIKPRHAIPDLILDVRPPCRVPARRDEDTGSAHQDRCGHARRRHTH